VPIIKTDFETMVGGATKRLPDERVSHFWDGNGELVKSYSRLLQLGDAQPAWDVYFVYGRDVEWKDTPPMPTYWMDQLDLEQGQRFNAEKLAVEIKKILEQPGK
jgi:hypothetical protein